MEASMISDVSQMISRKVENDTPVQSKMTPDEFVNKLPKLSRRIWLNVEVLSKHTRPKLRLNLVGVR
eukprot:855740-Karenia_brevis.AAC.1